MAWKNKKIKDDAIAVVVGSKIFPYSVKTPNPEKNPYPLFIDELEQPALDSLEAGLSHYKMTHKDCVSCYYTLKAQKTGVNFITYRKKEKILLLQHHYQRTETTPFSFDRFEFTDQYGKRMIYTFTTQFS